MVAKFGTSGLRGLVRDLTDGTAARHAGAFAVHLLESGRVNAGQNTYVGQDLRDSSPQIANQCMQALAEAGLCPIDCGVLPTPALALHAMGLGAASLMITGSHIPADRNGVKFYRPDGEIDKVDEDRIAALAQGSAVAVNASDVNVPQAGVAALSGFVKRYAGFLAVGALEGWRIGIYEHSSVARDVFAEILAPSGATLVSLGRSETFIPVDTEAVTDEVRALIRDWTREHRLDAIISADGDGDRPLLADETGECLRGDVVGLASALHVNADAVVTPITSNSGIEAKLNAQVWRTRVGSPFVIEAMAAAKIAGAQRIVGFEANGGLLTASPFRIGAAELAALPTRDCILPILATLAMAQSAKVSLSRLVAQFALPVSLSGLIREVPTASSQALIAALIGDEAARLQFFASFGKIANVDLTDGLRVALDGGDTLHLRPSGNAPEMRVYVEAGGMAAADAVMARAIAQVRARI